MTKKIKKKSGSPAIPCLAGSLHCWRVVFVKAAGPVQAYSTYANTLSFNRIGLKAPRRPIVGAVWPPKKLPGPASPAIGTDDNQSTSS